ncbi:MAG TPA: ATP-binding protein [Thermoanaerobaculia bacterium]|jgi:signal transduction histidine kinase/CheY-like chemotaxis protein
MVKAGIRRRFVVALSALVGLVVLVETAVLVVFARRHVREEIEQRALAYAELAVVPVCDAFARYSQSGISKLHGIVHDTAELNPDLRALAVYDTAGELVFHSDSLEVGARAPQLVHVGPERERPLRIPVGEQRRAWTETLASGEDFYVVLVPYVEEWGARRFAAGFYFSYDDVRAAMRAMAARIVVVGLVALLLGVAFAWILSAGSLGPVERLTAGARRLAEGELGHRIALATGDEFEVLSEALDLMAARLASTIEDLEASNQRLGRLNEELRELDRVKGDLLANVSHELRTPLTAISGYVEAFQEGLLGELDEAQAASLEVVERNLRRLRAMIDQLLSYSRMESGRLKVEARPFALAPVVRHVAEAVTAIHGKELDLRCRLPSDLPEVYGDAGRIAQVIENLVTNAVKFSPPGAPVELAAEATAHGVEVAVADRGIGIPEPEREKVFDRFYQVDASARRRFGGMGLGLAIVREILEASHSEIRLESRAGGGSVFRFELPCAAERTGNVPGRVRVALVDDDAGFVQATAAHLSSRGFAVETAATAAQGRAMIERVRPDAVVLDRLLPDGDGFELLAELGKSPATRGLPVIVATVRRERRLGLRLGAAAYLVKPVAPERVEETLREALGAATPEREEVNVEEMTP